MKKRNFMLGIAVVAALLFIHSNASAAKSDLTINDKVHVLNEFVTATQTNVKSGGGLLRKILEKVAKKLRDASKSAKGRERRVLESAAKYVEGQVKYYDDVIEMWIRNRMAEQALKDSIAVIRNTIKRLYRQHLDHPHIEPLKESLENMIEKARRYEIDIDDIIPPDFLPPITG